MADKKERVMSVKGFLHKTTTKAAASASAFLAQHRAWLENGELAATTSPILRKLDDTKRYLIEQRKDTEGAATAALEEIKTAVYNHWQSAEIKKGEDAMNRPAPAPKNWVVTIYDRDGRICTRVNNQGEIEDLVKDFELCQDADRWADRRLVDGPPDCYGVVQHSTMLNKHGEPLSTVVVRSDAIARAFKAPKGAVMRKVGGTTSALSFRPTVKNHVSKFSHG